MKFDSVETMLQLEAIDICFLRFPNYKVEESTRDVFWLKNMIGFKQFVEHLEQKNFKMVLAPKVVEAAWLSVLLDMFLHDSKRDRSHYYTYAFDECLQCISDCLLQVSSTTPQHDFSVRLTLLQMQHGWLLEHWTKKRNDNPGLDSKVSCPKNFYL